MNNKSNYTPSAPVIQGEPVVLTAIPVDQNSTVHIIDAAPERVPRTELERAGLENDRIGVCRRCRRQFERPAGVHDGSALYYRCPECAGLKAEDILNSCIVS